MFGTTYGPGEDAVALGADLLGLYLADDDEVEGKAGSCGMREFDGALAVLAVVGYDGGLLDSLGDGDGSGTTLGVTLAIPGVDD